MGIQGFAFMGDRAQTTLYIDVPPRTEDERPSVPGASAGAIASGTAFDRHVARGRGWDMGRRELGYRLTTLRRAGERAGVSQPHFDI